MRLTLVLFVIIASSCNAAVDLPDAVILSSKSQDDAIAKSVGRYIAAGSMNGAKRYTKEGQENYLFKTNRGNWAVGACDIILVCLKVMSLLPISSISRSQPRWQIWKNRRGQW